MNGHVILLSALSDLYVHKIDFIDISSFFIAIFLHGNTQKKMKEKKRNDWSWLFFLLLVLSQLIKLKIVCQLKIKFLVYSIKKNQREKLLSTILIDELI